MLGNPENPTVYFIILSFCRGTALIALLHHFFFFFLVSDEGVGEDISDKQPTVGAGVLERFNPYLAPIGDPFRSRQLLLSEKYRVLWLELLPNCSFSMKIYSPTLVSFYLFHFY